MERENALAARAEHLGGEEEGYRPVWDRCRAWRVHWGEAGRTDSWGTWALVLHFGEGRWFTGSEGFGGGLLRLRG